MTWWPALDVDTVYEMEDGEPGGSLIGVDIRGHVDTELVELYVAADPDEYLTHWADLEDPQEWEVTWVWRWSTPTPEGGRQYTYADHPRRGATPVTRIERPTGWDRWCFNHPDEPATSGLPADWFVDGEQVAAEQVALMAEQVDPRRTADVYLSRSTLYVCRPCGKRYDDARQVAMTKAIAEAREVTPDA